MNEYLIIPDSNYRIVKAYTHEMAYRGECCWYKKSQKIYVIDLNTCDIKAFRNLEEVNLIDN